MSKRIKIPQGFYQDRAVRYSMERTALQPREWKIDGELYIVYNSDIDALMCADQFDSFKGKLPTNDFIDAYAKGFKEGLQDFERDYAPNPTILYGQGGTAYVNNLYRMFYEDITTIPLHGIAGSGWIAWANAQWDWVTKDTFYQSGYYAAHIAKALRLQSQHAELFKGKELSIFFSRGTEEPPKPTSNAPKPFHEYLNHTNREALAEGLKKAYADKAGSGKTMAILIHCLRQEKLIGIEQRSDLYRALGELFGESLNRKAIDKYLDGSLEYKELEKHAKEVEGHQERVSEIKNSI